MKRPSLLMPVYGRSNEENDLLFSFRDRDWKQRNRSSSFCRAEEEESPLPRFGRAENPKNGVTSVGATVRSVKLPVSVWSVLVDRDAFALSRKMIRPFPVHFNLFSVFWEGNDKFLQQIKVKICPYWVQFRDSNSQPLNCESPPITGT